MRTSVFKTDKDRIVIIGSNGLIGFSITDALKSELSYKGCQYQLDSYEYPKSQITARNILALNQKESLKTTLILSFGPKGFGLNKVDAELAMQEFFEFCHAVSQEFNDVYTYLISSRGCSLSKVKSNYKDLTEYKEQTLEMFFKNKCSIVRIPSVYGYNPLKQEYSGLIGILMRNSLRSEPTTIFADMTTRRNYLDSFSLGRALAGMMIRDVQNYIQYRCIPVGHIEMHCARALSIIEVLGYFERTFRRRPGIVLRSTTVVDSESHSSFRNEGFGVRITVDSRIERWIRMHLSNPAGT